MERSNSRKYYRDFYNRAEQAVSKDNFDYALDLLKNCLRHEPGFAAARELLHEVLRKQQHGKPSSPIKKIAARTRLVAILPSAKKVTEQNLYPVMEKIEWVIAQDPFDTHALELLAQVAQQGNLVETAMRTFHEILLLDEKHLFALKSLGQIYQNRKDLKEARKVLAQAIRHYPEDPDIAKAVKNLDALGTIEKGQWDDRPPKPQEQKRPAPSTATPSRPQPPEKEQAPSPQLPSAPQETVAQRIEKLREQLRENSADLFLHYQLGELLFRNNNLDEAIVELQQAIQHPRRRVSALNKLGLCFKKKKMPDLAAAQFEKALEDEDLAGEEGKELLYNLGSVLEDMQKPEKAFEAYKKIYEADIGYRDVARKVEEFYKNREKS